MEKRGRNTRTRRPASLAVREGVPTIRSKCVGGRTALPGVYVFQAQFPYTSPGSSFVPQLSGIVVARRGGQVMRRASLLALVCVLPLATATLAQHEHHGDEDSVGWVPREILQRPVALREGIGKINDPVTTSSAEAQAFYNQGLRVPAFLRLDRGCPFVQSGVAHRRKTGLGVCLP